MTTLNPTSPDLHALQLQLLGRLAHFRRRVRASLVIEGVARLVVIAVALALISFVLDRVFRLGLGSRLVFIAIAIGALVREAIRHILRPARLKLDPVDLAGAIDRKHRNGRPPIAARVAAVLQLPDLLSSDRPPSEPMIRRAVHRSYESLQDVDFDARLDRRRGRVAVLATAAAILLPAVLALAFPSTAALWAKRWLLGSGQAWPQQTYLTVAGLADGRILVPRGEPSTLRVGVRENSVDPGSVALGLRIGKGRQTTASMTRFGPGDYRFDLPPLQGEATVQLAGGDDEFPPFRIEPVDRPRVVELALSSQHPTQAAPELRRFAGVDADMAFLPKTRLELTLTANVPVAEVRVKSASPTSGLADLRRLSDRAFALGWTHEAPVQMTFELIGTVGGLSSVPTPVSVGLKVDQSPRVTLQYTGVRQRVTPQARIPLNVQSRDDYGLAKVELATRVEQAAVVDIAATQPSTQATTAPAPREGSLPLFGPADPATQLEAQQKHEFDVAAERLSPGGLVSFTGRATDARYTGPQTGTSRTVTFRVVPPEELFREILLRQQAERSKFRKSIAESEMARAELVALASPETAANLARQHRVIQREVSRVATALGESVTEMRLNALGGQEAWDLMDNGILKPMRALNDGLMTEQRDALDALGRAVEPQKASEAATRQEHIVAEMNAILKQMSQWDSFVDVINQLNEIIKLQDNVRQNTERMKEKQTQGVFD